ncbi:MBL fold metallo-hydrolase [Amaricoccus macauensis]|uniref:MBL fold metallo-hydrolase n=1 Tax=Amaricoccus macauensis TaxID=57001 RepID=UPI003C7B236E
MSEDPFKRDHAPRIGAVETLAPGLRVVTAPNAGPMTYTGTRTHIVGEGRVAVIDPGPADGAHLEALAEAVRGETVEAVLVTHSHRDHSAGARAFADRVEAPILAHGNPAVARSPTMARLAQTGAIGGGEGIDPNFRPDTFLREGDRVNGPDWELQALHTPGHLSDHLCFQWGLSVFSGDVAMGWATTLISPPDGDLAAFRESITRLLGLSPARLYPGHGAPVDDPEPLLAHLLAHRAERERQILSTLHDGATTIPEIVARLYADVSPALHGAAARNVLAHLIDLSERGAVDPGGAPGPNSLFSLTGRKDKDRNETN